MILSRGGSIVAFRGNGQDVDVGHIAKVAARSMRGRTRVDGRASRADDVLSFSYDGICVHTATLGHGFTLCVLTTLGEPGADRLRKVRRFLAIALRDGREGWAPGGGSDGGGSGAPAEVSAVAPLRRCS